VSNWKHRVPAIPDASLTLADMLTTTATAARLNVHPQTVRRLVKSGLLPAFRVGHNLRFDPADISRFLEARRA